MGDEYVGARVAADLLGVKRETLYAYVSRGWLQSIPDPKSHRAKLYRRADLERLRARSEARAGDAPLAAGALRWGAPVLETRIGTVSARGPSYRGLHVDELTHVAFERVAELLWTGALPDVAQWVASDNASSAAGPPLDAMRAAVLQAELNDPHRSVPSAQNALGQGRAILDAMAGALGAPTHGTFAARIAAALGAKPGTVDAINTALVVCADHELNASTFACRVAASTGANVYAAVSAALAAFSGPRHGLASRRIRRLLRECADDPETVLLELLQSGEAIPGFGHPLYPAGDPRFGMLWAAAERAGAKSLGELRQLIAAAGELGLEPPDLDVGLVALTTACGLQDGTEAALFALGRTAGWVAHAREQAEQDYLLRPRATYVGKAPE